MPAYRHKFGMKYGYASVSTERRFRVVLLEVQYYKMNPIAKAAIRGMHHAMAYPRPCVIWAASPFC